MQEPSQTHSSCPRVLVVEDTREVRELLVEILEAEGYHVDSAINGKDALNQLRRAPYDVVLLDLMMPVMDGLALLDELKHETGAGQTPVIAMSAFERFRGEATGLGARAFIGKPIEIDHLLEAIEREAATATDHRVLS